jgi:hypothetical protein
MFVPSGFPFSSPASKELAKKLMETIREYQQTHSELSTFEIRNALRIARRDAGTSPVERVLSLALVAAALLVGLVVFFLQNDRPASGGSDGRRRS